MAEKKKTGLDSLRNSKEFKDIITDFKKVSGSVIFEPSNILQLDYIFGGGLPVGRSIQLFGFEGSSKSSIASHFAGIYQKKGKSILYIDSENKYVPDYALKTFGFDVRDENTVIFSQDNSVQKVFSLIIQAIPHVDLIVFDSSDAVQSMQAETGEVGDANVGGIAKISYDFFRKVNKLLRENNTTLITISHKHKKFDMSGYASQGYDTYGGGAWKFYASIRMDVSGVGFITRGEEVIGQKVKIKTSKNSVAAPWRTVELSLKYGFGFDSETEIFDLGKNMGYIVQGGAWYRFDRDIFPDLAEMKWQGSEKLISWLKEPEQKEFSNKLLARIKHCMLTGELE